MKAGPTSLTPGTSLAVMTATTPGRRGDRAQVDRLDPRMGVRAERQERMQQPRRLRHIVNIDRSAADVLGRAVMRDGGADDGLVALSRSCRHQPCHGCLLACFQETLQQQVARDGPTVGGTGPHIRQRRERIVHRRPAPSE